MNERIQELLEEAHRQTKGGIYNGHPSEWSKKFAELIIRECAGVCEWQYSHKHKDNTEGAFAAIACSDAILEHFVVDE